MESSARPAGRQAARVGAGAGAAGRERLRGQPIGGGWVGSEAAERVPALSRRSAAAGPADGEERRRGAARRGARGGMATTAQYLPRAPAAEPGAQDRLCTRMPRQQRQRPRPPSGCTRGPRTAKCSRS